MVTGQLEDPPKAALGITEATQLIHAGAFVFAVIPWTILIMQANTDRLLSLKRKLAHGPLSDEEQKEVRKCVRRWGNQNWVRMGCFTIAFSLGIMI